MNHNHMKRPKKNYNSPGVLHAKGKTRYFGAMHKGTAGKAAKGGGSGGKKSGY